jgi:hypothetical protein
VRSFDIPDIASAGHWLTAHRGLARPGRWPAVPVITGAAGHRPGSGDQGPRPHGTRAAPAGHRCRYVPAAGGAGGAGGTARACGLDGACGVRLARAGDACGAVTRPGSQRMWQPDPASPTPREGSPTPQARPRERAARPRKRGARQLFSSAEHRSHPGHVTPVTNVAAGDRCGGPRPAITRHEPGSARSWIVTSRPRVVAIHDNEESGPGTRGPGTWHPEPVDGGQGPMHPPVPAWDWGSWHTSPVERATATLQTPTLPVGAPSKPR